MLSLRFHGTRIDTGSEQLYQTEIQRQVRTDYGTEVYRSGPPPPTPENLL